MNHNISQICRVSSVLLLLAGCATAEFESVSKSGKDISKEIAAIDAKSGSVDIVPVKTISDGNFSYTLGDEKTRKFVQLNPNANLNDLNDFAIAKCWNSYLKPKIENCEKIDREDAVLLDFCMQAELNMIDTLAVAALGDMTEPGYLHGFIVDMTTRAQQQTKDIEGIYKDEANVFVQLKKNFLLDQTGIRVPMRNWACQYQSVKPEVLKLVFDQLQDSEARADVSNGSHPWYWGSAYCAGALLGGMVGTSIVGTLHAMSPDSLNTIETGMDGYNVMGNEHKDKWQAARNRMIKYVPEVIAMRGMLDRAKMQMNDSQSRQFVRKVLEESENNKLETIKFLDYSLYDLPFVVQTSKARARLKDCQGFFNDDEKKMMAVMADYNAAVSGTAMLKHIRSGYAANGYKELIKYFKNQVSKREFEDFVSETRIYSVNTQVDDKGLSNNELSEFKE